MYRRQSRASGDNSDNGRRRGPSFGRVTGFGHDGSIHVEIFQSEHNLEFLESVIDDVISQLMEDGHGPSRGPPPASSAAIASLTKKTLDRSMAEDGKASCAICIEDVSIGEKITELPCKHLFHHECIKQWLSEHGTCPHCRRSITSNDNGNHEKQRSE